MWSARPFRNCPVPDGACAPVSYTHLDVYKRQGERGRVSLAKLMLSEANFLILDEPTNHLDIVSKEILEQALNRYTGTVLYVSHDRYFINTTATRILDLTGGVLVNYIGNYDYYLEKHDILTPSSSVESKATQEEEPSAAKLDWQQQKEEMCIRDRPESGGVLRLPSPNRILSCFLFLHSR